MSGSTLAELLRRCRANPAPLTPWQAGFLDDVARRGREPTSAQRQVLEGIAGRRSARDVAVLLAARIEALATELVGAPPTTRRGAEWRFRRKGSLAVIVAGADRGGFFDHEAGLGGDALAMVRHLRGCGTGEAIEWAAAWLGDAPMPAPRAAPPQPPAEADADARARHGAALRIFIEARPQLAGTPAAAYLAARGIDFSALGRQPRALRFHPALWNVEAGRRFPALIAAVTDATGAHCATHRTWLAQDDAGVWRKAKLADPKMSVGRVAGGSIRLWRGASGRPLANAATGETVVLAEGIETALSVAMACPELRVLATVNVGNLCRIELPPAIRTVIVAADDDGDDATASRTLERAIDRFAGEGRLVRVAYSPVGKDFNDALTAVAA